MDVYSTGMLCILSWEQVPVKIWYIEYVETAEMF